MFKALNGVKGLLPKLGALIAKYRPEILISIGIIGIIATVILACRAAPKAKEAKEKWTEDPPNNSQEKVWALSDILRPFVPVLISGLGTIACLIIGIYISHTRALQLAGALTAAEETISLYDKAMVEKLGEGKARAVKDSVAEEVLQHKELPVKIKDGEVYMASSGYHVYETGKGHVLCYDIPGDRWFRADTPSLRTAESEMNKLLRNDMFADVNDFYDLMNLPHTALGKYAGFDVNRGWFDLDISCQMPEGTSEPVLMCNYRLWPTT